MSDIPEDIRKAAKICWAEADAKVIYFDAVDAIAKAIWSERQRCAKIAEEFGAQSYNEQEYVSRYGGGFIDARKGISQAILADNQEGK